MEQQSTPSGVIPYVEHHTGPKRLVTVTLNADGGLLGGVARSRVQPNLFVDGRQYIVYWGQVTVEVPGDRSVHVGVGTQDGFRGASLLLPADPEPVVLSYHAGVTGTAVLTLVPPGP